jgi:hypothetical protein
MGERCGSGGRVPLAVAALVLLGLCAPVAAPAATVVNGDFESGTLRGWDVHRAMEAGNWFAYEGSDEPIAHQRGKPVTPPPQGSHAAIADELSPDTLILSQAVALEPGFEHRLSLFAYYDSAVPIAVPTPDSLSVDPETLAGQANQQYRIDVIRAGAPIDSVDHADVLRTLITTRPGDPRHLSPTRLTADLTPFAGQTVRLRVAVAAHEELLIGGVDDVSIASAPPGQLPGAGGRGPGGSAPGGSGPGGNAPRSFRLGKAKVNPSNGTAILPVEVPRAGLVTAKDATPIAHATGAGGGATKERKKLIQPVGAKAAAAGTVPLRLKPTRAGLAVLRQKRRLRVAVAVTYRPTTGPVQTATASVVLKLKAEPRPRP